MEKHFEWLIPFFKDRRYEKINNRPLFMILNPSREIMQMTDYWQTLAKVHGYQGIHFIYRWDAIHFKKNQLIKNQYAFKYEPSTSGWSGFVPRLYNKLGRYFGKTHLKKYSYDKIWGKILRYAQRNKNDKLYYCAFVDYDDTPRRGENGRVVEKMTSFKFYSFMKKLYSLSREQNKKYLFITAWNEWGEGAYLEPDEDNKFELLHTLKRAIQE